MSDDSTEGVGGLVDEGHAVVVHAEEDVTHRGVLRLLAVAEHEMQAFCQGGTLLELILHCRESPNLVSSHRLLGLLGRAVELPDLLHEDRLVGPAAALLRGGVLQGLALLGVGRGVAHHAAADGHVLGVCSVVVPRQIGDVAGGVYCLQESCNPVDLRLNLITRLQLARA